jgi:hypothetical protein
MRSGRNEQCFCLHVTEVYSRKAGGTVNRSRAVYVCIPPPGTGLKNSQGHSHQGNTKARSSGAGGMGGVVFQDNKLRTTRDILSTC